jgi:hypothetical protein
LKAEISSKITLEEIKDNYDPIINILMEKGKGLHNISSIINCSD